jgi:hypothetical protein
MNEPIAVGGTEENGEQMIIGYNPSIINFLGHPFKR